MTIGDRPLPAVAASSGTVPAGAPPRRANPPGRRAACLLALAAALLAVTAVALLRHVDREYPPRKVEKTLYLPTGRFLGTAVLGFDLVAADVLWLRTIGYFGGHYQAEKRYPWLAHLLGLVTDLDPRFSIAYYFGGVVLALEAEDPDASTLLLRKGMRNLPRDWRFPFYAGFNYFYYKGDLREAAEHIRLASTLPGSPEYLPRLAASLYARAGSVDDAIAFLERLAATVEDERLRENIRHKIDDLKAGRLPEGLERVLGKRG